jgi:zinc-binding alcohol dehydrogenase/oxidoreductase
MDLWLTKGMPKPPFLPMVPGCDGAGTVEQVGPGVSAWSPGDEVVVNPSAACGQCQECLSDRSVYCPDWGIRGEHLWGAHGEFIVVGQADLVRRPAGIDWAVAAAYGLCWLTAYRMLERARLRAGETLLVVGAGGGVGTAALALGCAIGARVFAISRQATKRRRLLDMGAAGVYGPDDDLPFRCDVVVDSVGAPTWATALAALRRGGRLVICGSTAGSRVELNLPRLFFGQYEVIGSTMGTYRQFDEVTALVGGGLPVAVDQVLPLRDYPEALRRLGSGEQFGKIVLDHRSPAG